MSDLVDYYTRQIEWSARTFGPSRRTLGIIKHIKKELTEVEANPDDLVEWIDVMILAMDGFWRHGGKPEELLPYLEAKQRENFAREWPAPTSEDEAVEHVRTDRPLAPGDRVQLAEAGTVTAVMRSNGRYVQVDFPSIGTQWVKREDLVRVAAGGE